MENSPPAPVPCPLPYPFSYAGAADDLIREEVVIKLDITASPVQD